MALAHPSHVYPPLQQPGSLVGLQRRVAQAGCDDTVGDRIELGHSGSNGGCQVLFPFFIPLRPNASQAMVGHHFLKQILDREWNKRSQILITPYEEHDEEIYTSNIEMLQLSFWHLKTTTQTSRDIIKKWSFWSDRKGKHAHRIHERELLCHHNGVKRQETKSRKLVLKATFFLRGKRAANVLPWREFKKKHTP